MVSDLILIYRGKIIMWSQRQKLKWYGCEPRNTKDCSKHGKLGRDKDRLPGHANASVLDYQLPELWKYKFLMFLVTQFVMFCCGSPRRQYNHMEPPSTICWKVHPFSSLICNVVCHCWLIGKAGSTTESTHAWQAESRNRPEIISSSKLMYVGQSALCYVPVYGF